MLRYILRRVLQMIPTVFGVILITFILFNVVGGSPAAMTLGRHVTPRALEEFDEQRGFNKPLLMGWWTPTRAYDQESFIRNAGPWRQMDGVSFEPAADEEQPGKLVLEGGREYALPLAFSLKPATTYRVAVEYRMSSKAIMDVVVAQNGATQEVVAVPFSKDWKKVSAVFQTLEKTESLRVGLRVAGGSVEVRRVELRRRMTQPFDSQLLFYLRQLARLDFGTSSSLNQPVSRLMLKGAGPSLMLTVPIFFAEIMISVALALLCAFFRDRWIDRLFVVVSVALMSINYLVWIVVGQYLMGFKWGWFPVWGFASWRFLTLPILVGVISGLGVNVRFYRTIMLDEMYKDYVRTAFAKGVSRSGVLFRHVLKNAMIPIVTNVVVAIPFLYTGSLLLESFFGIPGLGYLGVNAVNSSDVDVVRAEVFIGAVLFVIASLVTDICYAWLDPRVKLE